MAFFFNNFRNIDVQTKNEKMKNNICDKRNNLTKIQTYMKQNDKFYNFIESKNKFLPILLSFGLYANSLPAGAVPEQKPASNVIDDSGSLTKSSVSYIEKSLLKLKEMNGGEVYFVSIRTLPFEKTPGEYAKELFLKWDLNEKDVVVVLANKIAKAGIYPGKQVNSLSEKTIKSIGEETYPFKAKEEQYGSAAIDVNNRLVSILSNKGDPGAPSVNRNDNSSNFKTAKKTEEQRSKYIAIIVILLVIAFVVPMFQFFWYVKDE